jgi:hypothetical protein
MIKTAFAALLLLPFLLGMGGTPKINMNLDFRPVEGGTYDINPQDGQLTYSDVKHYVPIVKMSRAMPHDAVMTFEIKEERRMQPDPVFGTFTLIFKKGGTTPHQIRTPNNLPDVIQLPGTEDINITKGSFWIGCTKARKLKSNSGKDNDEKGKIYVQHSFGYVNGYHLTGTKSPIHLIRCIPFTGGNEDNECQSMIDCPRGDCVSGPGIGHYECQRGRCRCLAD